MRNWLIFLAIVGALFFRAEILAAWAVISGIWSGLRRAWQVAELFGWLF